MTRHPLTRPSALLTALIVLLLGGLVVSLIRADDPAAPPDGAVVLKGHTESVYCHGVHARRQVRRHRQLRQDDQGVGRGDRQGIQVVRRPDRPHRHGPQRGRQPRRHARRLGRRRQHGQHLGLPVGQRPAQLSP